MLTSTKRATESFIVNIAGQTTIPVTGTLMNSSTGNVNLANGQIGVIAASTYSTTALAQWSFTDATPTLAETPAIAFVQGTPTSAALSSATATYPLWPRPYEISGVIDGRRKDIIVTKQAFRQATHNCWVVGQPTAATTGKINVVNEATYAIGINYAGRRIEERFSKEQGASLSVEEVAPNFTTLSIAQPTDWIVQKLAYKINRASFAFNIPSRFKGTDPVVAFVLASANSGPAGAAAGTAISALTPGLFGVYSYKGVTRNLFLTQEMIDSIKAIAPPTVPNGFTHIILNDVSNAGTTTGGTGFGILIMALDAVTAYIDRIPQLKNRIRVSLKNGFDYTTVYNKELVFADEGQGYGRVLNLLYEATQGQRKYAQRHTEEPVISFASPIVQDQQYVVYNVLHGNNENVDTFNQIYSPYREIIAIPRYSTGTTTNPVIALVDGVFSSWLPTTGNPAVIELD